MRWKSWIRCSDWSSGIELSSMDTHSITHVHFVPWALTIVTGHWGFIIDHWAFNIDHWASYIGCGNWAWLFILNIELMICFPRISLQHIFQDCTAHYNAHEPNSPLPPFLALRFEFLAPLLNFWNSVPQVWTLTSHLLCLFRLVNKRRQVLGPLCIIQVRRNA